MKKFWDWLKRNLSHIFSFIGVLLTAYFGIFYVPSWYQEFRNERVRSVNQELIEQTQELIYNNQGVDIEDLKTLTRGKELRYNVNYPYDINELLIQVQETFLNNNFIPLPERKSIIEKIDSLRVSIPADTSKTQVTQESDFLTGLTTFISISLGIISLLIGLYSLISKTREEREAQVENKVRSQRDDIEEGLKKALEFEEFVEGILNELEEFEIKRADPSDFGADFIINTPKGNVGVEVKYTYREGLSDIVVNKIRNLVSKYDLGLILVTNVPFTFEAKQQFMLEEVMSLKSLFVIEETNREIISSKIRRHLEELMKE